MSEVVDFESAVREALAFLKQAFGFDQWFVTRLDDGECIVMQGLEDQAMQPGHTLCWSDTLCSRMVAGSAPRIVPDLAEHPGCVDAAFIRDSATRAYMGFPLYKGDGELYGTLCGIAAQPQPEPSALQVQLFELLGKLLNALLQMELRAETQTRRAERFAAQALQDAMTGLFNRAGWEQLMAKEEQRCHRHGRSCVVIVIDLDELKQINDSKGHNAGDRLIRQTAKALTQATRSEDVVARLGGDEFGIIGVNCDLDGGRELLKRVLASLAEHGIAASVGMSSRPAKGDIRSAFVEADLKMYEQKRLKSSRSLQG
ncbi:sensor domain-containing diguanylate cyclase [Pseudomonas knackmussii]|uniref:sensor domain-containing diguanylate cyclase n=1 Tax=Pseudomonas knackmussii TaxID=65741 RepID=UPI0013637D16|nr:sensor domain-containing diguanylate cyclase [Pseudomonas knackmussii]